MRIFITGGTGFIGQHLLLAAASQGHSLSAIRRDQFSLSGTHSIPNVSWITGSLSDNWTNILSNCDALLHLAAYGVASTDSMDWDLCFQINLGESLKLWQNAISAGIRRIIIIGSCFEYGLSALRYSEIPTTASLAPISAYGASKAAATMAGIALAVGAKTEIIILRPFHVYGPGEHHSRFWPSLINAGLTGEDFRMTHGEQVRDFQDVNSTCRQILFALNVPYHFDKPNIYNLGSGSASSLKDFAKSEWHRIRAKGRLLFGEVPYRPNEIMRYVPKVEPEFVGTTHSNTYQQ